MDEFVEQFLLESRELVEQGTSALAALEKDGNNERDIDSLFRAVHTLKGAAGIVDFDAMGTALHAVEGLLSELRAKSKRPPLSFVADCYACLDQVTRWLDEMQTTGAPPPNADAAADGIVRRFDDAAPAMEIAPPQDLAWLERLRAASPAEAAASLSAFLYRPAQDAFFRGEDPLALTGTVPGLAALDLSLADDAALDEFDPFTCTIRISAFSSAPADELRRIFHDVLDQVEIVALQQAPADDGRLSAAARALLEAQILMLEVDAPAGTVGRIGSAGNVALNILRLASLPDAASAVEAALAASSTNQSCDALISAIEAALHDSPPTSAANAQQPVAQPATRSLRVDMDRIDALVNLTGELMVVKNAIGHIAGLAQTAVDAKSVGLELRQQHDLFERLVQQLQRAVLDVRVLPLRHVFQRFPRLVREISATLDKPVKFSIEGDATEADAAVVESLFEPLLHVIRNAIGHGVEDPAGRAAAGKPAAATITLRARRQLENVVVEVEDDGRGIDIARVRQTALARQVATADELAAMSDTQVVALIFAPGFSTAAEITGLSGRGVGMDAVKTAVERVGGSVSVDSRAGQGTSIQLNLPFSVMMTRVMTVEVAGQSFGLPLDAVVETALVAQDAIIPVGAGRAVVLRDRTLPVLDLTLELGLPKAASASNEVRIVVIAAGDQFGAIEVDRVGGRMDVMLKPMEGLLQGMGGVAGTTLMGDGRVLVVLDVQELFT
jgi:two-component system chemotaxis sensor kinase CheA